MRQLCWPVAAAGLALALEALPRALRWLRAGRRPRRGVLFFLSQVTCTEALLQDPGVAPAEPPAGCRCSLPHGESSLGRAAPRRCCTSAGCACGSSPTATHMAFSGSQVGLLRKAGIKARHDQDLGYMHHRFATGDKKVLITGSLNWTTQAIQNNRENVLIMEDEEYVRLFLEESERIWEEFNTTKYTFFPQKKRGP